MSAPPAADATARRLQRIFIVGSVVLITLGVVLGPRIGPLLDGSNRWLIVGVLGFIALSGLVSEQIVLTSNAKSSDPDTYTKLATLGFGFAESTAVYGLVAALMSGEGLIAIPFGMLAMYKWLRARNLITRLVTEQNDSF